MKNEKNDKIELSFDKLCEVIAKLLEKRAILLCPCGVEVHYGSRKDFKKHIIHCFYWKL